MSKSTVRKEVVHPGHGDQAPGGSSATDEFERFFAEQFRPAPVAQPPAAVQAIVPAATSGPVPVAFDDPLMAELARIVGQQGMQRSVASPGEPVANAAPARPLDPLAAFEEELRRFDEMHRQAAQSVSPQPQEAAPIVVAPAERAVDAPIAALEQELRHFDSPHAPELRGMAPEQAAHPQGPEGLENEYQQAVPVLEAPPAPVAPPRSKRVVMMLGAASVIALVGVAGAVMMKSGQSPSGGKVPVIAANTQPMKEKPADPGGVEITGQDRQVLAKGNVDTAKPATMVSKEEQPVDLNQTPKREVSRVILPPTSGQAPAAAAAPIILPAGAQAAAAAPQQAQPQAGGFEAKRVRSVRVGPQGEAAIGTPPAAAATAATAAVAAATAAAAAPPPAAAVPAPKVEAPRAPTATPKSEARPATAARSQTTTPQQQRQAARPAPAATAEDDDDEATDNKPLSLRPPAGASPTRAVARTTTATTPTTTPQTTASTNGGGFSVQLAAAGSEAEARSTASSMKQKYSALSGYTPGWRSSEVNGRTVYRVRVGNLSRAKANELCGQIKSGGGSCFVAGN